MRDKEFVVAIPTKKFKLLRLLDAMNLYNEFKKREQDVVLYVQGYNSKNVFKRDILAISTMV